MPALSWVPEYLGESEGGRWHDEIREPRVGVCLHYDGSVSDGGALSWFDHPDCRVSYQILVLDDGSYRRIAPDSARAWHAGRCKPSDERLGYEDANSALYGIAAATNDKVDVTPVQLLTIAWHVRRWFESEGWDPDEELWRIVGHEDEAWPRGRKTDPSGGREKNPIYTPGDVRGLVPLFREI